MTRAQLGQIIATMDADQVAALRICIMAERRLRVIYPRTEVSRPALTEAYEWALEAPAAVRAGVELPDG